MNKPFLFLMFLGTFFTASSQVLLKQSAKKSYTSPVFEYLNWRVLLSYGIFFGVLLLNTYAYTKVDMKYGAVVDTFSYIFVLLLSSVVLKEKITGGKLIGNAVILAGILIYTLG